jgi:hypothetical protein
VAYDSDSQAHEVKTHRCFSNTVGIPKVIPTGIKVQVMPRHIGTASVDIIMGRCLGVGIVLLNLELGK